MNKNTILLTLAAAVLLPGCNKDLTPAGGDCITIEATVGPATKVTGDGTKASFSAGDKIAVYAWTGSTSEIPAEREVDGIVNTLGSDGKWSPASPMYWKNAGDAHYFLGVSPVHAISSLTADAFSVDPADYAASDLLFAARLDGLRVADGPVKLSFRHAMAKLVVNLSFRSQFGGTPEVGAVTLGAKQTAVVNYLTQTVGATGDAASVSLSAVTANSSYSAILVPQAGVRKITVSIAGKDYVYTAGTDIPLASGQITTLNLTVGKDLIELASGITIADWVDDALSDQELASDQGAFQLSAYFPQATLPMRDGWQAGDVLFVFFSGQAAPKYLEMKWNGSAWACAPKNGLALGASESGIMRAVFLPFASDATVSASGTDYAFSTAADCYLAATLPYAVTDGVVRGAFDLALPKGDFLFFLPDGDAAADQQIELREPHLTPIDLASFDADGHPVSGSTVHGAPLTGRACIGTKKGYAFYGSLAEDAWGLATDYRFTLVRGGWQGEYAGLTQTGKTLYGDGNVSRTETLPESSWEQMTDTKPIDLGCDVDDTVRGGKKRIYWASRNLGARKDRPAGESPLLIELQNTWGDYYAWGETEPYYEAGYAYSTFAQWKMWPVWKTGYNWDSYPMETAGNGTKFTKYTGNYDEFATSGTADGRTVLEPEDDAASVHLGGNWRMPTYEEWKALRFNTRYDWAWDGTVEGCIVTVKGGTAWSDPTIYLPAAGGRFSIVLDHAGSVGLYWSSTIHPPVATIFYIYTMDLSEALMDLSEDLIGTSNGTRDEGRTIRPVTD